MNRSFSKIRHIQEANLKLEKRLIKEETDELRDDRLQKIIDMDQELDNDPTYQRYEKLYSKKRIADMIKDQMGMDLDEMGEEEVEMMLGMFTSIMDISKSGKKFQMDRETLLNRKESLMELVRQMEEMAAEDNELELVSKLRDYNKLIQDYN
jgi:gas vesicle protein